MPMKELIVIMFIASAMLMIAKPAFRNIVSANDFNRRAKLWFIITAILFLSNDFWIFMVGSALAIHVAKMRERNYVALYFMLLFVAPMHASSDIYGFGVMNYMFTLNPVRLLELLILLPAALMLSKRSDTRAFGRVLPDKLLLMYMLLTVLLQLRGTTITDSMRFGFYTYIDIFLPYYVFSRSLKNMDQFKDAMVAMVVASLILAGVAMFEFLKHWLLYTGAVQALGVHSGFGTFLMRGGDLRAQGSAGQSIVLGYVLMITIGFYHYLYKINHKKLAGRLVLAVLAGGLFASISRGPWVGALAFLIVYNLFAFNALGGTAKLASAGVVALLFALLMPGGEKLINLLPFVGSDIDGTTLYRQRLFEMAMVVIQQHLWFGSVTFLDTPEMQSMMQGQGIIDLVNSYLEITLKYGLVGLGLFVGFFGSVIYGLYKSFQRIKYSRNHGQAYVLGVTLFSLLPAILLTIATVSSILLIPMLYWAVAGMAVGYIEMNRNRMLEENQA